MNDDNYDEPYDERTTKFSKVPKINVKKRLYSEELLEINVNISLKNASPEESPFKATEKILKDQALIQEYEINTDTLSANSSSSWVYKCVKKFEEVVLTRKQIM